MEKVGLPKGLIRYATEAEIEDQTKFQFTTRMKAYAAFLFLLVGFLGFLLYNRGEMEAKFIKPAGSTYFIKDGVINNTYNYTLLNKSNNDIVVTFKILEPDNGHINYSGKQKIKAVKDDITKGTINIQFPEKDIKLSKQNITIGVFDPSGEMIDSFETYYEGPFKMTL